MMDVILRSSKLGRVLKLCPLFGVFAFILGSVALHISSGVSTASFQQPSSSIAASTRQNSKTNLEQGFDARVGPSTKDTVGPPRELRLQKRSVTIQELNENHPLIRLKYKNKLLEGLSDEERELLSSRLERTASNSRFWSNTAEARSSSSADSEKILSVIKENKKFTKLSLEDLTTSVPTTKSKQSQTSTNVNDSLASQDFSARSSSPNEDDQMSDLEKHARAFEYIKHSKKFTIPPNYPPGDPNLYREVDSPESRRLHGDSSSAVSFINVKVASRADENFTLPPPSFSSVEARSGVDEGNGSEVVLSTPGRFSTLDTKSTKVDGILTPAVKLKSTEPTFPVTEKIETSIDLTVPSILEQKNDFEQRNRSSQSSSANSVSSTSSSTPIADESDKTFPSSFATTTRITSASSTTSSSTSTSSSSSTSSPRTSTSSARPTTTGPTSNVQPTDQSASSSTEKPSVVVFVTSTSGLPTAEDQNKNLNVSAADETDQSSETTVQVNEFTSEDALNGLPVKEKVLKKPINTAGSGDATAAFVFLSLGLVILFLGLVFLFKLTKQRPGNEGVLPYSSRRFSDA